jgi:ABC-type antimicrobial peptide transport system permease subunit
VREIIRELDRNVPIVEINTADEVIAAANAKTRFATMLMIGSSALALLLGLIGVYGASWYAVRQRRQEIGVRVALGAAPRDILRMILSTSTRLVVISIALGLAGALAVTRALKSVLFETSPTDPATFAIVIAGLVLAVLVASYWPARHASLTNPLDVLRAD